MKNFSFLIFLFLVTKSYSQDIQPYDIKHTELVTLLGQNYKLDDRSELTHGNRHEYKCNYTSDPKLYEHQESFKFYYMYEAYNQKNEAAIVIQTLMKSNQGNEGLKVLEGVGDFGFLKTDYTNYCTIIICKGNHLLRLKANKLNTKESISAIEKIAKEILARL
jgi:hypothetical protein